MGKSKLYLLSIGTLVTLSVVVGSIFAASPEGSGGADAKPPKQAGSGTVTAISGSKITLQGKKGSVIVDASTAKVITISTPAGAKPIVTNINLSDIKVGDTLRIQGSISGTSVMATQIVNVTLGGGAGNSVPFGLGNQPPKGPDGGNPQGGGDMGGLGQNKPENPTKCVSDCEGVGRNCVSLAENKKKECDSKGQACRFECDDRQYNDAKKTRACYSTMCTPAETACYNQIIAEESVCTTTKDECVTACQKAAKPQKPARPPLNGQEGVPNNCPAVGGNEGPGSQQGPGGPGGQKGPGGQVGPMGPNGAPKGQMPAQQQPPMSQEAENAIINKDFSAWVKAMTANGEMPAPLKVVTQDNFPKFVEAHGYQLQAKELNQKARDILQSLGITEGPGFGNGPDQGQ
ncbi:hypothetical protein HZA44_00115 [Candidatus Peregrinibacteria bacterium]|nr:hypothetical protein [Candidatus Peregrinibacteria bacterium]